MRKRLLNEDDDSDDENKPIKRRAMKVIQLNPKTKTVLVIVLFFAAIIYLMNFPIFSSNKVEEFDIPNDNVHDVIKAEDAYVSPGSLKFKKRQFYLDGQPLRILSGAVHYFRIPEDYWDDILKKAKAAGLNTIDTYVPWNLHEDRPGNYYFAQHLDIEKFLRKANDLGLYVIFRPGPYICSEWEFGGLPGWLLKDPDMVIRSNYKPYQDAVDRWFGALIPKIKDFQRSKGGPIIAVQVENEFGHYSDEIEHLLFIKKVLLKYGIQEMLLTSDNGRRQSLFYNQALPTVNFQNFQNGKTDFERIKAQSKDFPLMVMEFWSGWFDHWGEEHHGRPENFILSNFEEILKSGASVSIYMFHGGTNFGFMAGANNADSPKYGADVSSYDYGAPISESGDTTPLYHGMRDLITKYTSVKPGPVPPNRGKAAYGYVEMLNFMSWTDMLDVMKTVTKDINTYKKPLPMEYLTMMESREGYGQNYGYIVYRRTVPMFTKLEVKGTMKDRMQIVISGGRDNKVLDWKSNYDYTMDVSSHSLREGINYTLDIIVENLGRANYANKGSKVMNKERKGITGEILLDDKPVENWTVYPLTFNRNFIHKIYTNDKYFPLSSLTKPPCLFRTNLKIEGPVPKDTFLQMEGWGKGIVFVNEHHLGRYWSIGPQKTLFVPAPYLKAGYNSIIVFEEEKVGKYVSFLDHPLLT
ncbi:beta-galactosidase-1-like protein 2 [Mytilus edulis]|uniref:beta-galactosidase-1-like protein 2 n=1 Tax=Mytilus edulis TaxID=6550 RepID=UPI0039EF1C14